MHACIKKNCNPPKTLVTKNKRSDATMDFGDMKIE
jgi:hypothetical protein